MPDINLLFITITDKDFTRIAGLCNQLLNRPTNPFARISPEKLTMALVNSIEYMLSDRLMEGIGRGGWGRSDKEYMKCIYGLDIANQVQESVMTTVVVVHALHDCLLQLDRIGVQFNGHSPRNLLDIIVNELDEYIKPRWDPKKGHGGVLVYGHDGDLSLTPRYRHTAWLLQLWNLLPGYRELMRLTATNLFEEFDKVNWIDEKVATAVAAHSAISLLEGSPLYGLLGSGVPGTVMHFKHVLEGQIQSKFSRDLSGWTSGNTLEGGRQMYTLFVCAEMACMYSRPEDGLTKQMCAALEATMREPWRSIDGQGVPLKPGEQGNISASSLAASALMRKPQHTYEEKLFLANVIKFLIESLASGQNAIRGTFSWALSYFVRDISRYLATNRNKK